MMRFFLKSYYSIESIIHIKNTNNSKICFRKNLKFLKIKNSLSQNLSNRLVIKSNYYKSFLLLNNCFIKMLRINFCYNFFSSTNIKPYMFTIRDNKKFFNLVNKTNLAYNIDYLLTWKASQYNILFNIASTIKKKKKKKFYLTRIFYMKPTKRLLFIWKWLSIFIRSLAHTNVSRELVIFKGLENFLISSDESNVLNLFKLQIYKVYLLRIT